MWRRHTSHRWRLLTSVISAHFHRYFSSWTWTDDDGPSSIIGGQFFLPALLMRLYLISKLAKGNLIPYFQVFFHSFSQVKLLSWVITSLEFQFCCGELFFISFIYNSYDFSAYLGKFCRKLEVSKSNLGLCHCNNFVENDGQYEFYTLTISLWLLTCYTWITHC